MGGKLLFLAQLHIFRGDIIYSNFCRSEVERLNAHVCTIAFGIGCSWAIPPTFCLEFLSYVLFI